MSWRDKLERITKPQKKRAEVVRDLANAYRQEHKRFSMFVERVNPNDLDPKYAQLGQDFEAMKQHELCQEFLPGGVSLYLTSMLEFSLKKPIIKDAGAYGTKVIDIPKELERIFTPAELKAVTGHELGHMIRLDLHPRRKTRELVFRSKVSEDMSDALAVVLSGEPEALISALQKIAAYNNERKEEVYQYKNLSSPYSGDIERWVTRQVEKLNPLFTPYRDFETRAAHIRDVARRLEDPEEKEALLKELKAALTTEHKKLFPKRFKDKSENARG